MISILNHLNYFINLINSKWLFYNLSYNLKLIKLEILKIYIKINLIIKIIKIFKLLPYILIYFICKNNRILYFYVNFQDFNNLIIKN